MGALTIKELTGKIMTALEIGQRVINRPGYFGLMECRVTINAKFNPDGTIQATVHENVSRVLENGLSEHVGPYVSEYRLSMKGTSWTLGTEFVDWELDQISQRPKEDADEKTWGKVQG